MAPLPSGKTLVAAGTFAAIVACEIPTGIEPRHIELLDVTIIRWLPADGGFVQVAGVAKDSLTLDLDERVPISIATSGGDLERVPMWYIRCMPETYVLGYSCYEFLIVVENGVDTDSMVARIRRLGAIPVPITSGTTHWSVFSPDPLRTASIGRTIAAWDGIVVDLFAGNVIPPVARTLSAVLPVAIASSQRGDGTLQISGGDTIVVTYVNPSGDTLRQSTHVP